MADAEANEDKPEAEKPASAYPNDAIVAVLLELKRVVVCPFFLGAKILVVIKNFKYLNFRSTVSRLPRK